MKDRRINYRGVEIVQTEIGWYKFGSNGAYDFGKLCDKIDQELDVVVELTKSEVAKRDLVGKEVVVGYPDGRVYYGALVDTENQFSVGGKGVAYESIDNEEAVIRDWGLLSMDAKGTFSDLSNWGQSLVEARNKVSNCTFKVDRLFNQIKNI